jgi:hypothetical protein
MVPGPSVVLLGLATRQRRSRSTCSSHLGDNSCLLGDEIEDAVGEHDVNAKIVAGSAASPSRTSTFVKPQTAAPCAATVRIASVMSTPIAAARWADSKSRQQQIGAGATTDIQDSRAGWQRRDGVRIADPGKACGHVDGQARERVGVIAEHPRRVVGPAMEFD